MSCQALDSSEVLSIRWAKDDPNPVAQESMSRADKDALASLLQARGISIEPAAFEYPADYQLHQLPKRARGDVALCDVSVSDYPDTDIQYDRNTIVYTDHADSTGGADKSQHSNYSQHSQHSQHSSSNSSNSTPGSDFTSVPLENNPFLKQPSCDSTCSTYIPHPSHIPHPSQSTAINDDDKGNEDGGPVVCGSLVDTLTEKRRLLASLGMGYLMLEDDSEKAVEKCDVLCGVEPPSLSAAAVIELSDEVGGRGGSEGKGKNEVRMRNKEAEIESDLLELLQSGVASDDGRREDTREDQDKEGEDKGEGADETTNEEDGVVEVVVVEGGEERADGEESREENVEKGEDEWTAHIDPDSGATYYYNSHSGESSWGPNPS